MVSRLLRALHLEGDLATAFGHIIERVHAALIAQDAELIEINPLVLTTDGRLIAADAKVLLDEDAAFRHPGRRAAPAGTIFERRSRESRRHRRADRGAAWRRGNHEWRRPHHGNPR